MAEIKKAQRLIPKPNPYIYTQPFWDGAKQGKLLLQYDPETGKFQHYPRPISLYTGKRNLVWREVSGRGKVYAYTVIRTLVQGFEDRIPYVVATIELAEGVRILGNILNCSPEEVKIGMPVKLCWEKISDEIMYPAFELDR